GALILVPGELRWSRLLARAFDLDPEPAEPRVAYVQVGQAERHHRAARLGQVVHREPEVAQRLRDPRLDHLLERRTGHTAPSRPASARHSAAFRRCTARARSRVWYPYVSREYSSRSRAQRATMSSCQRARSTAAFVSHFMPHPSV